MITIKSLKGLKFNEEHAQAEPLFVNENNRLLRFALKPGQEIKEHSSPSSPVFIKILKGRGVFWGEDRQEQTLGTDSLIVFKKGELHGIKALDEELVFVAALHGAPHS